MSAGRAEATADALLGLVLDGTFPPGSSLPSEAELAGRFAVSRLTVREAIRSLASTQVIRVQQGRSSIINPVEQWSALDPRLLRARGQASGEPLRLPKRLLEARRVIEVAIAEMAAERRTEDHLQRMAAAIALDAGVARRRRRSPVRRGRPRVPRGPLRGRGQRVPRGPDAAARLGHPGAARGDLVGRGDAGARDRLPRPDPPPGRRPATPRDPGRTCASTSP